MYIPAFNRMSDRHEAINFMRRYSFATLVTTPNGVPAATHLPFVIREEGEHIILLSHFARANPQANDLNGQHTLVIFIEPHAYISPQNYESDKSVPTWNYLAVHAYGKVKVMETEAEAFALLEEMINAFEGSYLQQWQTLPVDFREKMVKGIVAFSIEVTDLQGKSKLSQNRSEKERLNIISQLSSSAAHTEQEIAQYMRQLEEQRH